jgi:gliding motility-associated-like protein
MWYDNAALTSNIGSGNPLTIPAPVVTTTYYVRFEGTCDISGAVSTTVNVKPFTVDPVSASVDRSMVCPGDGSIVLSYSGGDPGSNGIAVWYAAAAFTSSIGTGNNLSIAAPDVTTTYYVRFEADCDTSAAVSVDVDVWPVPDPIIVEGAENVCINGPLYRYVASGLVGSVFNWNIINGTIVNNYNDTIYVDWGSDKVTGTIELTETSVNGCVSAPVIIEVAVDGPDLDLGGDAGICMGTSITIDPDGDYTSYLWQDGSIGPDYTTDQEGWIRLEVTDITGCSVSDSMYLSVYDLPVVDLGPDITICGDQGIILDAGGDGASYIWSTGEISQSITVYEGPLQLIWVEVTDANGCMTSDTITIDVCDVQYYFRDIPTAITPGLQDGKNDVWIIDKLVSYTKAEVEIYDRWGTLIWRSEPGYSNPWDGRNMRGREVPMDSYHFVIDLKTGDKKDRFTGIITVIR